MDPYSRRFTWDVIRKRASTCSIMLTTHFLDEADLLCDRVAIMSAGKLVRPGLGIIQCDPKLVRLGVIDFPTSVWSSDPRRHHPTSQHQ
jgi:ABC-type multidrug transport system ATPase subunit